MIDILDVCLQIKSCLASLRNINWFHHRTTCFLSLPPPVLPEYPVVLNRWGRQLNGTTLGPKEEVIVQLAIIAGYKLQQSLSSFQGDDVLLTCRVIGGKCSPSRGTCLFAFAVLDGVTFHVNSAPPDFIYN